nr:MAG TPA: minor tail protein [Caudoviricetes sp.]
MAEDLSIKLKVEPDGGGVQGKLNEIAKKSKLKVKAELANESELADKIKNLTSNITAHLEIDPADITKITNQLKNIQSSVGGNVQLFDMSEALKQLDTVETKVTSIVSELSNVRATISTASAAGVKGSTKNPYAGIAKTLDSQLRKAGYDVSEIKEKGSQYQGLKSSLESLTNTLEKATAAQAEFAKELSDESLQTAEKAIRKLKDEIASLTKTMSSADKTNENYSSIFQKSTLLGQRWVKDVGNGKSSLIDGSVRTSVISELANLRNAKDTLDSNFNDQNLKNYEAALRRVSEALSQYKTALDTADKISDNAFDSLPDKLKQLNDYIKTLEENLAKAGVKDFKTDNTYSMLSALQTDLSNVYTNSELGTANYQDLLDVFSTYDEQLKETKINVKSLSSLFAALGIQIRNTTNAMRSSNLTAKNTQSVESLQKRLNNLLYTLRRYVEINKQIQKNPELMASYNSIVDELKTAVRSGNQDLMETTLDSTAQKIAGLKAKVQELGLEGKTVGQVFSDLFGQHFSTAIAMGALHLLQGSLQQIYQNVVDIDTAMTELKKVTNETDSTYQSFLTEAGARAKNIGTDVSSIVNATADYARLGYSLSDATKLADVSAIYYNVGDDLDSFDKATENIVGTMKAFNIQANDAISLVDKLNNVSNNYAVSSGDLGDILQRSASAMEAAGNTLDQTIALGTAMNSVVQNAETTGSTLKVLALRIRGATTELEQMGEETDTVATSTSKLRADIMGLTNVDGKGGFDILTKSGDFKSTYDIIQGIAKVYSKMSDVDQAALLELLAGKNRANGVAALLSQASQAADVLQTSLNSSGSAMAENERVLDSVEGRLKIFEATFQEISTDLLNSGLVKGVISLGTALLDASDGFIKFSGVIPTATAALSAFLSLSNAKTKGSIQMLAYAGGIAA